MKLKRAALIVNKWKDEGLVVASSIASYLEEHLVSCTIHETEDLDEKIEVPEGTDLLVSVGGDGTVLYSSRLVQELGIDSLKHHALTDGNGIQFCLMQV